MRDCGAIRANSGPIVVDHSDQLVGLAPDDQLNRLGKLNLTGGDVGQVGTSGRGHPSLMESDEDQARLRVKPEQIRNEIDQVPRASNPEDG